tara:strand:+ start:2658 stop:6308 length:3651 start_codon:yes stop_codon:yes gene_type:complete
MAGKFVQGNWLLPNNVNANKQSNYSLNFNGSSYINTGFIPANNLTLNCSISAWVNMPDISNNTSSSILGTYDFGGSRARFFLRITRVSNIYKYFFGLGSGTGHIQDSSVTISNFSSNTWVHLALTYDGADVKLYSNGTLDGTLNAGNVGSYPPITSGFDGISYIGATHRTGNVSIEAYLTGKIDELNIFSRALSSSEVSSLYNSGTPGNPFDLSGDPIAYYKLGETAIGQAPGGTWNWQVPNHAQSQQAITATNGNSFTQLVTPTTQLGNTHTLSIWINSNGVANIPIGQFFIQGSISSYYNPYTNSADGIYVTTDQANSQSLPLSSIIYRSNNNELTASIGQLDDNNWHNLIIVRTPTAVKAYIDGGSELTLSGATLTASDTYLLRFLTGVYSSQGAAWPGIISNPAIWLSDRSSEVANIYNSGEPQANYTTSPDYWWKLDNSTQISAVPPTTGTTPIINYKTISSNTLTTFNSKTAVINQGYGFSSGISMLFDNQINLGTQSTVSYWLLSAPFETSKPKFNTHGGGVNIFSNFSDQVGVGTYGGAYILKGPVNDVITLEVYNSTSSSEKATLTFSQANNPTEYAKIFDLNYHNWMFVRDGSNVSFYFDNVLIDSSSSLNATNNTVLKRFSGTMGTAASPTTNWGGNKFSNGVEVDEISLFNKVLSSSERATLYNSGNAGDISSLSPSIWYNGDSVDFTNSKMLDLSGNSNDASLVNTSQGSSNTGLLTNFQQFLIYKEGAFTGGSAGTAGLALVNTDLGLHNPLYSQFSTLFNSNNFIIPDSPTTAVNNNSSISFWVKTNTTGNRHGILNKRDGGGQVYYVYVNTDNTIAIDGGGAHQFSTGTITQGEWAHVALTISSGSVVFYINGSSAGTGTVNLTADDAPTYLGSKTGGADPSNAYLSNVALFIDKTLSVSEVISIYNNGKPSDISSLLPTVWWKLGDAMYTNSSNKYLLIDSINGNNSTSVNDYAPSISADAPKVVAPGASSGLVELDKKGNAPNSTINSISYNILKTDQSVYTPKYVSQYTVDNNYSMAFDGNDIFSLGSSIDLGQTNTMSFWIYYPANGHHVVTGDPGLANNYGIYINNGNNIFYRTTTGYNLFTPTPTLNAWTHLAFTKNNNDTYGKMYFNGVEQSIVAGSQNIRYGITKFNTIGAKPDGTSGFVGKLDEFAVWDKELTADQIKFDIYGASTTANKSADFINNPNLPDPVAWYRMGD